MFFREIINKVYIEGNVGFIYLFERERGNNDIEMKNRKYRILFI